MAPTSARMQYYLVQYSYTPAAWDFLLRNESRRNRPDAVRRLVESFGGCIGQITFPCDPTPYPTEKFGAFGDHDVVVLLAFPDDQAAAGFAMAVTAGGGVSSFKTTRILTWSDTMEAMSSAAGKLSTYEAPGKK